MKVRRKSGCRAREPLLHSPEGEGRVGEAQSNLQDLVLLAVTIKIALATWPHLVYIVGLTPSVL